MNKKGYDYLILLIAAILVVAVFAGIMINKSPADIGSNPSGYFALGTCAELNNLFVMNNCYGPGEYDGYTCMKIMQAKHQKGC